MRYMSTRNKKIRLSAAEAIAQGLSREGGLFVPEILPRLPVGALRSLCGMSYRQRAVYVMQSYLDDYTTAELSDFTERAYGPRGFDNPEVTPIHSLDEKTHFLELWHGPTCAFKDLALQILPYFLTSALTKTGENKSACILVATSGDTGKAALEGFCDVPRTKIMVFYPRDGVSDIQKLQMTSQKGSNVGVYAVNGNFDDAQTGVKAIFSDERLREELAEKGWFLSSANSINWGRLLPQIVYYISSYCDLLKDGKISDGEEINFCVPTGNFGDILAGYYARAMGLPIKKLICASNKNDVLTDFINTGIYDRNREFYTTISPSMDILVSSNLERLLFDLSGGSDKITAGYMSKLSSSGTYEISKAMKKSLSKVFSAGCCGDAETKEVIGQTFKENGYLIDTHTAVAYGVLKKYRHDCGDEAVTVVVSTASPYKFCESVLSGLGEEWRGNGPELIGMLEQASGVPAPRPLKLLGTTPERFSNSVDKEAMLGVVKDFLK